MTVIDRPAGVGEAEEVAAGREEHEHSETIDRRELARIAVVITAAVAVWFRVWEPFNRVSVIGMMGHPPMSMPISPMTLTHGRTSASAG